MGIQDLDEQLHKHDGTPREPLYQTKEFDPSRVSNDVEKLSLEKTSGWSAVRKRFAVDQTKAVHLGMWAIGVITLVALLAGTFVRIQQSLFSQDRVTVSVTGPSNVNSSDITDFVISYENANRSGLADAELIVSYPPGFIPEGNESTFRNDASSSTVTIGTINAFEKKTLDFSGKFYGSKDSIAYIHAELRYRPNNVQSQFSSAGQKSVNLRSASLAVELEAPLSVPPSGEVNYLVNYENTSDATLSNIRMKAAFPSGFSLNDSDPKPSEGEVVWYLGSIAAGERGKIRLTGNMSGVPNETKTLKVEFGTFQGDNTFFAYSDAERTTRIVAAPFSIRQSLNGSMPGAVNPGDSLRYTVSYRNDSEIALREAIITVELEGDALDFSQLRPEKGAYDSLRKTITWKASDIQQLANLTSGASGKVEFAVPVRDDLVPKSVLTKNFQIRTIARIESPDVPNPAGANKIVATDTMWEKVNSRLLLETAGYYQDSTLPNTGPIPPAVGKSTTYTMHWLLSNTTNDVTGVEVSADLPTGVAWTGKTFPNTENISYNERTNKIIWNVGSLGVGEGILSPKRTVVFQVSIRPEVNQVDTSPLLLGMSSAKATDVFTNETIQSTASEKTTNLREDDSLPSNSSRVVNGE
ncbi:MAG: hypothetical protein IPK84_03805 [Candidatus Moraniibacteriota bacterium]|nr:MAG: hypothetical protein IPK84_03805 [Candidatus Moranbacteria bacterium]